MPTNCTVRSNEINPLERFVGIAHLSAYAMLCLYRHSFAERSVRSSKIKQKVSGTFRSPEYAAAYCRISSYLQSMSLMGYNPLTAIQIALQNKAADILTDNE